MENLKDKENPRCHYDWGLLEGVELAQRRGQGVCLATNITSDIYY